MWKMERKIDQRRKVVARFRAGAVCAICEKTMVAAHIHLYVDGENVCYFRPSGTTGGWCEGFCEKYRGTGFITRTQFWLSDPPGSDFAEEAKQMFFASRRARAREEDEPRRGTKRQKCRQSSKTTRGGTGKRPSGSRRKKHFSYEDW